jgi:hypothetical protein
LAELVTVLRHQEADTPSILASLSQRPKIWFTVTSDGAVSLLAALIRVQRLDGILEAVRFAGLLTKPSKTGTLDLLRAK